MIFPLLVAAALSPGCLPVPGPHITAGDLARAIPLFGALPPGEQVAASPRPGARRVLSARDLALLARRFDLPEAPFEPVCFAYPTAPLDAGRLKAALEAAFGGKASVTIVEQSGFGVADGEMELPDFRQRPLRPDRADGSSLIRGNVRYGERQRQPFWVRVRIDSRMQRPVAARAIAAGETIDAGAVRLAGVRGWEPGEAPASDAFAGMAARRRIGEGTPLERSMFSAPPQIVRGDPVRVEAVSGAAHVALESKAESGGRTGDLILLRNAGSGRRYQARVTGPGRARLDVGGGGKAAAGKEPR